MFQDLSGILVIDKPPDITSAGVVARIKRILKAKKAGHTGTLDPFATGVMVCCINRATKLSRFFLEGNKKYEAVIKLGVETDTFDLTGKIIATRDVDAFSEKKIIDVFNQFEGAMEQLPPVYSALKHKGVPLYKLARKGNPVQKPPRHIFISRINILDFQLPEIRFEVNCSSGTYIRTLCADIGSTLGCGGHLKELRRTESCGFSINEALTLSTLESIRNFDDLSEKIINMNDSLRNMEVYVADKYLAEKIENGKKLMNDDFKNIRSWNEIYQNTTRYVKIVNNENNLLAVVHPNRENNTFSYCCVFN